MEYKIKLIDILEIVYRGGHDGAMGLVVSPKDYSTYLNRFQIVEIMSSLLKVSSDKCVF